jgi:hypothetical protein
LHSILVWPDYVLVFALTALKPRTKRVARARPHVNGQCTSTSVSYNAAVSGVTHVTAQVDPPPTATATAPAPAPR